MAAVKWLFSLFIFISLHLTRCDTCQSATVVNVAVILPYDDRYLFSYNKTLLSLAFEPLNCSSHLFGGRPVVFILRGANSECNAIGGPLAAFDFYQRRQVDVFFGPVYDYSLSQVTRYATRWDLPVISSGGFAHDFA